MDKIICVGKNYSEHAFELHEELPEEPVLFIKPPSTLIEAHSKAEVLQVELPRVQYGAVHPECELVLRLDSHGVIKSFTLGLDMTLRDLQKKLKSKGHPWEISKTFKHSTVVGPWFEVGEDPDYLNKTFEFYVNDQLRQSSTGKEMRFSPTHCIEFAQTYFLLCDNDLLFTGTPAGVASVQRGDLAEIKWNHECLFQVKFL